MIPRRSIYLLLASLIVVGWFSVAYVNAAECYQYTRTGNVPSGYGATYSVLDGTQLLKGSCDTTKANITVSQGGSPLLVHNQGYTWDGSSWIPFTFSGTSAGGNWLSGGTANYSFGGANSIFVAAYICEKDGGWKCGCRSGSQCSGGPDGAFYWSLQKFVKPSVTPPPSTNGPFIGSSSNIDNFASMTGKPVRIDHGYPGRGSGWVILEGEGDYYTNVKTFLDAHANVRHMVSYPLIPNSEGGNGAALNRCAAGEFNGHYQAFGVAMKNLGLNKLILRPGWEWNLDSWPWGTNRVGAKAELYAACFRNFVSAVDQAYPGNDFIYEWNANSNVYDGTYAKFQSVRNAAYPGNEYVDVIGLDMYDTWFNSTECESGTDVECRFNKHVDIPLQNLKQYASEKGKPTAISEWGVWTLSDTDTIRVEAPNNGDNPYFIRKMCEYFNDPGNEILYQVYFDTDARERGGGDHRLSTHPQALNAYQTYCTGKSGSAVTGL